MLLVNVIKYNDEEIKELIEQDLKKAAIIIEFYSLINWCIVPIFKEERIENFNELNRIIELFYKKYDIKLIDKIKNKKFLSELFEEIIKDKIKEIEEDFSDIPIFD